MVPGSDHRDKYSSLKHGAKNQALLEIIFPNITLITSISALCSRFAIENGYTFPPYVMEGSIVHVTCNVGFRISGAWELKCNDTVTHTFDSDIPECIPITRGKVLNLWGNDLKFMG